MSNAVFSWVLAAGTSQSLFLAVALMKLNVRNRYAAGFLSCLLVFVGMALFNELLDVSGSTREYAIGLTSEFGIPPTLYFFLFTLLRMPIAMPRGWILHYIPLLVSLVALIMLHLGNSAGSLGIRHPDYGNVVSGIILLKVILFAIYGWFSLQLLRAAYASADRRDKNHARALLLWLTVVLIGVGTSYISLVAQIFGFAPLGDADTIGALVGVSFLFAIAYFLLGNKSLFDRPLRAAPSPTPSIETDMRLIDEHLIGSKLYCDPDFGIRSLATTTGMDDSTIKTAVDVVRNSSFHEYISGLRLKEFRRLTALERNASKTTLELAYAAGFNSKASFYRAFRKKFKTSPSAFRKEQDLKRRKMSQSIL